MKDLRKKKPLIPSHSLPLFPIWLHYKAVITILWIFVLLCPWCFFSEISLGPEFAELSYLPRSRYFQEGPQHCRPRSNISRAQVCTHHSLPFCPLSSPGEVGRVGHFLSPCEKGSYSHKVLKKLLDRQTQDGQKWDMQLEAQGAGLLFSGEGGDVKLGVM